MKVVSDEDWQVIWPGRAEGIEAEKSIKGFQAIVCEQVQMLSLYTTKRQKKKDYTERSLRMAGCAEMCLHPIFSGHNVVLSTIFLFFHGKPLLSYKRVVYEESSSRCERGVPGSFFPSHNLRQEKHNHTLDTGTL